MDSRTRSIIIGVFALLILAVLFGIIFYFNRLSSQGGEGTVPDLNINTQTPDLSTTPATSGATQTKTYAGAGFEFEYPANWSLLTCSGNQNFELDPAGGLDQKDVSCSDATKPVTVLVYDNTLGCQGEPVTLGSNQVVRSKSDVSTSHVDYRWCANIDGKGVEVSHRVSASGAPAHSSTDYSAQVEQMIATLKPATK